MPDSDSVDLTSPERLEGRHPPRWHAYVLWSTLFAGAFALGGWLGCQLQLT